jgi:hypothetical protein
VANIRQYEERELRSDLVIQYSWTFSLVYILRNT